MPALSQLLDRLVYRLGSAIALTGHVMVVHDDCPRCDARTLCEVSVLHQHYRCVECGRAIREDPAEAEKPRRRPPSA
jgi:transposase-like protein